MLREQYEDNNQKSEDERTNEGRKNEFIYLFHQKQLVRKSNPSKTGPINWSLVIRHWEGELTNWVNLLQKVFLA